MDWREEADRKRAAAEKLRATIPPVSSPDWHRGAVIAALTRLGTASGMFSGEHVEGDEFFARLSFEDLCSLLEDMWYLSAAEGKPFDVTPPDVPDVPEPEFKVWQGGCRCDCGYTCNRKCGLPLEQCMENHYVVDCEHQWDGEALSWEDERGGGYSVTCAKCGADRLGHDMVVGP